MSIKMPSNPALPEVIFNNSVTGFLAKDMTGQGAIVVLTDDEAMQAISAFTGTLAVNVEVVVPSETKIYFLANRTSGAFSLTIKTAAGAGVVVGQGANAILICDGTDVLRFTGDI